MKSFASLLLALAIGAGPAADALAASSLHHTKATAKSAKTAKAAKKAGKKAKAASPARPTIDYDGEAVNFSDWQAVRDFEDDIVARNGFDRAQVEDVIKRARFIDSAVQLHGGLGVTVGSKVEELYRDIRALRIYEGAIEVQRMIIARDLLK